MVYRGLTKGDKILIIAILLVSVLSIFTVKTLTYDVPKKIVVIESQGREVKRYILGPELEGETVRIKGQLGYSIIEIGKDRVRMLESACPDKHCIEAGWISRPGEMIVCLPNRVIIRLLGVKEDVDDITY